ncbi:chaperone for protein-folding within the ER, fungal-domain-containing protein [Flagelloscypha sp. PMI_526]|nr:chaperone for protein-folding within the ER, fungal-domain-containing protein [Flagelloscypha sp. PMI_526]
MLVLTLFTVLAALAADKKLVAAQSHPDTFYPHNTSSLEGFWASGRGDVRTGDGFANPINRTFNYPPNAGLSVSFDNSGWFELSRYRYLPNGKDPNCIKGIIGWMHGTYEINSNGSLTMYPLEDGFQQVQDPCAGKSFQNFIETYNTSEVYQKWQIYEDSSAGTMARLYQYDSSPLPPMKRLSETPNMLPRQKLANATGTTNDNTTSDATTVTRRSLFSLLLWGSN